MIGTHLSDIVVPDRVPDRSYVRDQTAGLLLRNLFHMFFGNYLGFLAVYYPLAVPLDLFRVYATASGRPVLLALAGGLILLGSVISGGALTVAVSDVCLGSRPSLRRAYRKALLERAMPALGTFLLLTVIISGVVGAAAVVVALSVAAVAVVGVSPIVGIVLIIVLVAVGLGVLRIFAGIMFTSQVVVLENLAGLAAVRRSFALGRGAYGRNIALLMLTIVVSFVPLTLVLGLFTQAASQIAGPSLLITMVATIFSQLVAPIFGIGIVLLYYDMRARKEGYDLGRLTFDLEH